MTPTVQDILNIIEIIAPPSLAESWDNVGLMIGNPAAPVRSILFGLDPTLDLLDEACSIGANLLITHHPVIFHPLRSVNLGHPDGRFIDRAIRNQINVISSHTNLDSAPNGVSDILARKLGLADIVPLLAHEHGDGQSGLGRLGNYAIPIPPADFIHRLREACDPPWLLAAGRPPEKIARVAVCGGSCSDLAPKALQEGAQVFVTSEVKHDIARWAEETDLWVVDAGHFASENPAVHYFATQLASEAGKRFDTIPIGVAGRQHAPLVLLEH